MCPASATTHTGSGLLSWLVGRSMSRNQPATHDVHCQCLGQEVGGVGRAAPRQDVAQQVERRGAAAANGSPVRASRGGPPRGERHDRCGTPAQVIGATAGGSLRLSLASGLLALQLLQFTVDRA